MSTNTPPGSVKISANIRKDIIAVFGEDLQKTITTLMSHMIDAVECTLTIHQRYHCLSCMQQRLIKDFYPWLNEEGYIYVLEDYEFYELAAHATRWAVGWIEEQMLSPCSDGMESIELH
jgi:hypothetical protein